MNQKQWTVQDVDQPTKWDEVLYKRQQYTCKDCGYNYTVVQKSTTKPDGVKQQALQLYLEGLGFRSIGRILKVSHVAVYNWTNLMVPNWRA